MSNQPRKDKGTPAGGEFDHKHHGAVDIDLDAPVEDGESYDRTADYSHLPPHINTYGRGTDQWVDPAPVGDDFICPNGKTLIENLNDDGYADIDAWMTSEDYEEEDGVWYGPDGDTINGRKTYLGQKIIESDNPVVEDALHQQMMADEAWINDAEAANAFAEPEMDPEPANPFAEQRAAYEASIAANAERAWGDWSSANVNPPVDGARSKWGTIQYVDEYAPGITHVGTAGHGGIVVSPERNKAINPAWRNSDRSYEEDCEWAKVAVTFPDEFSDERVALAQTMAGDYFPDEYEEVVGLPIEPGTSYARNEKEWAEHIKDRKAVTSAVYSADHPDMTEVTVRMGGRGDHARGDSETYLVPREVYKAAPNGKFALPDDHSYTKIETED